jgi:CRISPR/Cas system-associated endonuclease Cas3-HD
MIVVNLLLLLLFCDAIVALLKHDKRQARVVVSLHDHARERADAIATEHGYRNLGEHESLSGYFIFEELENRKREVCCFSWFILHQKIMIQYCYFPNRKQ